MKNGISVAGLVLLAVLMLGLFEPQSQLGSLASAERPVANVPVALRQINWLGPHGTGSCAWASLITDLNWSGEFARAQRVRATHGDGVTVQSLCAGLTRDGVPYVWTSGRNDVAFLEQALAGRRGVLCGVNWEEPTKEANHMIVLSHLDAQSAAIIDPNYPSRDRWMTRDEFLSVWFGTGSIAFVPLYSAVPPMSK